MYIVITALRIGEDGEYILNGNFMVMHRKVIVHPGVTIEYSGPESVVERLNSSRPIIIDLILEAGLKFIFRIIFTAGNYPEMRNLSQAKIRYFRCYP